MLPSPSMWCWLLFLLLAASIAIGRDDVRFCGREGLCFFLILMLGPCCLVRYAFVFYMLAPLMLGMMLCGARRTGSPDLRE